ncbi:carbohydrate kinase [Microvirga sp. KLBC 81]|uniref:FGGY-family carbohydrate kinase n=1 Tax=Microvirga sp. KLBC 81 TaxID=1862707 RepID=UPI000D51DC13|nr:FGGY-family carbohydrate kinase [Microvirga sp. KLBC 81]PVE22406.1 carbohydrate kinase [Microvirga sp. KLBC 81]
MRYYLGIDIGTYESKGALVDSDGQIVATASQSHRMQVPRPGWAEHDADRDWWGDFVTISRSLLSQSRVDPAHIRAIGPSGIGPCMLPVDEAGTPLMNAVLYGVDTRAVQEIEELTKTIGIERLLSECGNSLTSQSVGPKILWLKRNRPELFARTHKILNSSSFLVHKLTGRFTTDHYTACGSTPLYSAERLTWDDSYADLITGPERLPDLLWTTDVAGTVTPAAAEATGLAAGTPVITGTVDAAAEAVSVGVLGPGEMMIMYGSTIFIIMLTAERVRDPRLWYSPWLFEGQHACMSGLATSGTLTHWFRERFAGELDPASAVETLAREAAQSPAGSHGLIVLPYFSGERTPIHDPHAKGVIFGLDLTHSRADIYRAFLEGIAYGVNHIVETYAEAGQKPTAIEAVGGGTKNQVWSQAVSDITGDEQTIRSRTIGASYGNAFLAAVAIGDVQREDIRRWNPVERTIEPDRSLASVYSRQFNIYKRLYAQTKDLMAEISG